MESSIAVAMITSAAGIFIALIGAYASSGRAVAAATQPLKEDIERLKRLAVQLGGDPDDA